MKIKSRISDRKVVIGTHLQIKRFWILIDKLFKAAWAHISILFGEYRVPKREPVTSEGFITVWAEWPCYSPEGRILPGFYTAKYQTVDYKLTLLELDLGSRAEDVIHSGPEERPVVDLYFFSLTKDFMERGVCIPPEVFDYASRAKAEEKAAQNLQADIREKNHDYACGDHANQKWQDSQF